jgi:hypothetical protein
VEVAAAVVDSAGQAVINDWPYGPGIGDSRFAYDYSPIFAALTYNSTYVKVFSTFRATPMP